MLVSEWDMDTALRVRGEEGFEEGVEVGMKRGVEVGMERGMERATLKTALAMKENGIDVSTIARITGLPVDAILNL